MGNSTFISDYSSWHPAFSDRSIISINAEEYTCTDILSEKKRGNYKRKSWQRLSGLFDRLSGCRGKTSPGNAVILTQSKFCKNPVEGC